MNYSSKIERMILNLRKLGIDDERVLRVMQKVPRHEFVAPGLEHQAYDEKALPIGFGQTISHPYTVALMSQTLQVKKGQRILEIGTGSGYQAAVLCELGAQVFTIEKVRELAQTARQRLDKYHYHYVLRNGDGSLGWQNYAPFDAIIVTAGAPVVPETLLKQLTDSGRMLIPLGDRNHQILTLYIRNKDQFDKLEIAELNFVPLLGAKGW